MRKKNTGIIYFVKGNKTEQNYFKVFKRFMESYPIYKDTVLVEVEPCAADTLRVIEKAEDYVRKNELKKGQIWCVYDKDSFPKSNFNAVEERTKNLNEQNPNI